jgi:hypothetical protein
MNGDLKFGKLSGAVFFAIAVFLLFSKPAVASIDYDAVSGLPLYYWNPPAVDYAQEITLAGSAPGYTINALDNFFIDWTDLSQGNQSVILSFYTGANLSPAASDAFAGLSPFFVWYYTVYTPSTPPVTGFYYYDIPLPSIPISSNTFALRVQLANLSQTYYSSAIEGVFSDGNLSIGSNPTFIWNDSSENNVLSGSDQSTFGSSLNIATEVDATPVPEPAGMTIFSIAAIALLHRLKKDH